VIVVVLLSCAGRNPKLDSSVPPATRTPETPSRPAATATGVVESGHEWFGIVNRPSRPAATATGVVDALNAPRKQPPRRVLVLPADDLSPRDNLAAREIVMKIVMPLLKRLGGVDVVTDASEQHDATFWVDVHLSFTSGMYAQIIGYVPPAATTSRLPATSSATSYIDQAHWKGHLVVEAPGIRSSEEFDLTDAICYSGKNSTDCVRDEEAAQKIALSRVWIFQDSLIRKPLLDAYPAFWEVWW